MLRRADVEHCQFFVACTGLDEVNIVACAIANRIGSPETICLVSRADFIDPAGRTWGTARLVAVLEQGEARVFELTVPPTFVARDLKDIGSSEDAIVAAIPGPSCR